MTDTRLPRLKGPTLTERQTSRGHQFLLPNGRIAGIYKDRVLYKRVNLEAHLYRKRGGLALNYELLRRLDGFRPRPARIYVERVDRDHPTIKPPPLECDWRIVIKFAIAAAEGDDRYLITDVVDPQVVVPFGAWNGTLTEVPPAPVEVPNTLPLEEIAAEPLTLDLDLPGPSSWRQHLRP